KHGVEDFARFLRITIREQLHRALEVGEEHRDLLALTFEGALGGEDLLGEVLRSVRLGAGEAARRLGGERYTAGPAEFLARRDRGATARTGRLKPGAAVSQKRAPASVSAWHRGHFIPETSKQPGRRRSGRWREIRSVSAQRST